MPSPRRLLLATAGAVLFTLANGVFMWVALTTFTAPTDQVLGSDFHRTAALVSTAGVLLVLISFALAAPAPPRRRDSQLAVHLDGGRVTVHKVSRLLLRPDGQLTLSGVGMGGDYHLDDTATCHRSHTAPNRRCHCGFHGLLPGDEWQDGELRAMSQPGRVAAVLVDAELWGQVDEYPGCVVASHQRVLGVRLPAWCHVCAGNPSPEAAPTAGIGTLPPLTFALSPAGPADRTPPRLLASLCAAHLAAADVAFTAAELADTMGVDATVDTALVEPHREAMRGPSRWLRL